MVLERTKNWCRTSTGKAVAFYVLSRILCLFVLIVVAIGRGRGTIYPHEGVSQALGIFDGTWYEKVAGSWYPHGVCAMQKTTAVPCSLGFFPVFPALLWFFHLFAIPYVVIAEGIDIVCGSIVVVLINRLVRTWIDGPTGLRTAMFFAVYPMAVVLSLTYTEAIFSAAAIGGLYALSKHRWILASFAIAAASLARPTGVILVVVCAAFWFRERRLRNAMPAIVGLATYLGWLVYLWGWTGSPLAYFTSQKRGWGVYVDFGRKNVADAIHSVLHPFARPAVTIGTVFFVGVIVLLVWMWKSKVPWTWSLYATLLVGAAFGTHNTLSALPRLCLPAFPLLVPLGQLVSKWPKAAQILSYLLAMTGMLGVGVYIVFFSSYPP